jgi:virginiamycin A acetyltransferase
MKALARTVFLFVGQIVTAPPAVIWAMTGRRPDLFRFFIQSVFWIPGSVGSLIRGSLLRWMIRRCGVGPKSVKLGTLFSDPRVELGDNVHLGPFCDVGWAVIEDYVHLGSGVHVISGGHGHFFSRTDVPIALQGGEPRPVRIGYGSWIGNRAIVLADVGEECVIGAGSVVTKPIPPWSVAVGSPARVVSSRKPGELVTAR